MRPFVDLSSVVNISVIDSDPEMAKSKRDGTAQQKSYDASKRGGLLLTQTRLQQPSNPAEAEATGTARSARFKKTRRRALDPKAKGKPAAAGEVAAHGIKQLKVTDEAGAGKVAEAGSAVVKAMTESSSKRLRERGGGSTEGNGGSKRGALAEAKQAEGGNTVGCGRREAAGMGGRRDGEKAPSVLIERGGVAVSGEAAAPGAGKKVDVAFKASCGTKEAQTTDEAGNDDEGAEENMRWRLVSVSVPASACGKRQEHFCCRGKCRGRFAPFPKRL